ncbi:MAG: GTP cyclohydrolase FolE2 [Parcubacteria group bacterium]|jgi:GTP cyclohydrolase I
MKDVQKQLDNRKISINEVGITNLKIPLYFPSNKKNQLVIADITMGANLPAHQKGTHMSRFAQIATEIANSKLDEKLIKKVLQKTKDELKSDFAKVEFSFLLFLAKSSPISKNKSFMDYDCKIVGELGQNNIPWYSMEISVPIATLCPCSKEISRHGAHNQRADVVLKLKAHTYISPIEVIQLIEKTASSALCAILKREDEKFVTEKMYENPKFVEDVVRDVALWAKKDKRITTFQVQCISYESIHNHNAYAIIINNKKPC